MSNAVSDRRDSRLERLVAAPMLRGLRRGGCFPRWLLWIAVAAGHDAGQWHIVPKDDLVTYEAFEYAIKTVNTMRKHCNHMVLAPLATVDFGVVKADVRSDDVHTTYRLAIDRLRLRLRRESKGSAHAANDLRAGHSSKLISMLSELYRRLLQKRRFWVELIFMAAKAVVFFLFFRSFC